jgi:selenide,water dikinase
MRAVPVTTHPDLLVGYSTADDAGVYRLDDKTALVQTVDFFPPIVDDPFDFGRIAAANALSDIYAMGGRPLTALNILCFPSDTMPIEIITEVMRGGQEKLTEAGAILLGGHSVKDKELKYGVAVTGLIDPTKLVTNAGARPGDRLYLTKPLGTGLITTGIKNGIVDEQLVQIVTAQMAQLNKAASELMVAQGVHAATDITGFGLLGHALEMAEASKVTIHIDSSLLPLMPTVLELAEAGMFPGGARANREFVEGKARLAASIDKNLQHVLFDPQTSGGLFIAVPESMVSSFENEADERNVFAQHVGRVGTYSGAHLIID